MSQKELKLVRVTNSQAIPLVDDLLIGRAEDCGLRIVEGLPSRRHAQITLLHGDAWVEDLGSSNGTYVNGVQIAAKTKLNSGDRLRFDVEEFDFQVAGEEAESGEKTLYRKPPERAPAAQATSAAAPGAVQEAIADASGIIKRPGAWADPDSEDGGAAKTKFMDPATLKAMIAQSASTDTSSVANIDAPHLVVVTGSAFGAVIKLQGGIAGVTEWNVGTAPEREVVFIDSGVSALHAKIVNDGTRWKVLDQMSANGTFVNGKRSNVSFLSAGDRVRFGPVECEFNLPSGAKAAPSARSSGSSPTASPQKSGGGKRAALIAIGALSIAAAIWWFTK